MNPRRRRYRARVRAVRRAAAHAIRPSPQRWESLLRSREVMIPPHEAVTAVLQPARRAVLRSVMISGENILVVQISVVDMNFLAAPMVAMAVSPFGDIIGGGFRLPHVVPITAEEGVAIILRNLSDTPAVARVHVDAGDFVTYSRRAHKRAMQALRGRLGDSAFRRSFNGRLLPYLMAALF